MFQLNHLRSRVAGHFKARSAVRDSETDQARIAAIFHSVATALDGATAEEAALKARIDGVLARAAVTMGNDSDEYLTRDTRDNEYQTLLNLEIANVQRRLKDLGETMGHFRFLKTVVMTRFPDFKP